VKLCVAKNRVSTTKIENERSQCVCCRTQAHATCSITHTYVQSANTITRAPHEDECTPQWSLGAHPLRTVLRIGALHTTLPKGVCSRDAQLVTALHASAEGKIVRWLDWH